MSSFQWFWRRVSHRHKWGLMEVGWPCLRGEEGFYPICKRCGKVDYDCRIESYPYAIAERDRRNE